MARFIIDNGGGVRIRHAGKDYTVDPYIPDKKAWEDACGKFTVSCGEKVWDHHSDIMPP